MCRSEPGRDPRRDGRSDELSPRELEIAELAVRGLSNRDIATRLRLSERTVENTLGRAMAKQGVARRSELRVGRDTARCGTYGG